ncbi:D-alanyl-D-alanine carboxypeptidase [Synechococcales cyanobacterium C]|uniref:D-alanyl-D-alanine carboxypeptidase n=2 Tax=Petrachloros TaxID=2918834 RepID=A0A8K2A9D8_9CYAN|nr:D-alanyl-D-alanine carboxypeptidase [Petrachloros mirabilis ULC683]
MKAFRSLSPHIQFIAVVVVSALSIVILGFTLQATFAPDSQSEVQPTPPQTEIQGSSPTNLGLPDLPGEGIVVIPGTTPPLEPSGRSPEAEGARSPQSSSQSSSQPSPPPPGSSDSYFGHLPYAQNDQSLVEVGQFVRDTYQRTEYLDIEAANAFLEMQAVARTDGVYLMPISGFRTIADQNALFVRQVERQGSEAAAAQLSAPPGYSEHHTGFAIDIADEQQPDTDLKFAFEFTGAYEWLARYAKDYGFELSFPPENAQEVSFEPWHWRFIGSQRAAATFRQAMRF